MRGCTMYAKTFFSMRNISVITSGILPKRKRIALHMRKTKNSVTSNFWNMKILNKRILTLTLAFVICVATAIAQITVITGNEIKKSERIDELIFRAQYELNMLEDTIRTDSKPNSETMMLEVGKQSSIFYSYTTYLRDSVLMEDVKNNVSQELMTEHSKAYGNARITYRIYKNYPAGKVTTLDRIVSSSFRCEEENEKPQWTLLADTATILTYRCQKASCYFRGRHYTAWYTMEIPVSEGPWKLCGLPGLILKAEDSRGHYSFQCNGLQQFKEPKPLLFNAKGYESVSRKELNKIYERYFKDPIGYIASTAPNVKVVVKDQHGNPVKKYTVPYNPIELSER